MGYYVYLIHLIQFGQLINLIWHRIIWFTLNVIKPLCGFPIGPVQITRVTSYPSFFPPLRLGVLFAPLFACIVREGFDPSTDGNSPELGGGGAPQPQFSTSSAAGRRRLPLPEEPRRDQKEFETELLLCLQGEKRGMKRRVEIFLR